MMKLVVLLLMLVSFSHQSCHRTTTAFYRRVSKDLWASQNLRESLFFSLRETTKLSPSYQTYFAITTLLDGLRRRTIDLYPLLDEIPKLREMSPKDQMVFILEELADQRHIGCAAELASSAFKADGVTSSRNLTKNLDHVKPHNRAGCLNEMLDIFWSYLCTCRPTQPLIGGILVNLPVHMSVADARQQVSGILHDESIEKDTWVAILDKTDPQNKTITEWIADVLRLVANETTDAEACEALADGIVQIQHQPDDEEEPIESEEDVGFRIAPKYLEEAGYVVKPTREDRGIYRLGPAPAAASRSNNHEIPKAGASRRT